LGPPLCVVVTPGAVGGATLAAAVVAVRAGAAVVALGAGAAVAVLVAAAGAVATTAARAVGFAHGGGDDGNST